MTLYSIFLSLLFASISLECFSFDISTTVVTDPGISRRCNALIKIRDEEITYKQRLFALIVRNEQLQKIAPPHKQNAIRKLKTNYNHLKHQLKLTQLKIQFQEENIVKRGCPGIIFSE